MDPLPPSPPPLASPDQAHWSVAACFRDGQTARAFVHHDYSLGEHTHDFVELNLVLSGRGWHFLHGTSFVLDPGQAFVIPPGVPHAYRSEDHLDVYHLLLHPRFFTEHRVRLHALPGFCLMFSVEPFLRAEAGLRHALRLDETRRQTLTTLLDQIHAENQAVATGQDLMEDALALAAVVLLSRWSGASHHLDHVEGDDWQRLQRALEHLHRSLEKPLALAELAAASGLGERAFSRLFTRATGSTPKAYLSFHRVQVASRLLADPDLSITEIGQRVGFYDTPHFCRTFARLMGLPPARYRRRYTS